MYADKKMKTFFVYQQMMWLKTKKKRLISFYSTKASEDYKKIFTLNLSCICSMIGIVLNWELYPFRIAYCWCQKKFSLLSPQSCIAMSQTTIKPQQKQFNFTQLQLSATFFWVTTRELRSTATEVVKTFLLLPLNCLLTPNCGFANNQLTDQTIWLLYGNK